MRRRYQRNKVSSVTSQPARCRRGKAAATAPSRARSSSASAGRLFCRCRTASWWRSTMISRSFECPERTAKRANDTSNRYRTRHMGPRMASVAPVEGATTEFRPATDSQHAAHHAWSAHTTAFSGTHRVSQLLTLGRPSSLGRVVGRQDLRGRGPDGFRKHTPDAIRPSASSSTMQRCAVRQLIDRAITHQTVSPWASLSGLRKLPISSVSSPILRGPQGVQLRPRGYLVPLCANETI